MGAYYNENNSYCAAWLRNLMSAGHIAPGDVDERSIVDVRADELRGYTQCHFFAGIGGWSYALRLAGWPDDRPVWTGSCPCQPFSAAGAGKAANDERHLWPRWFSLVKECGPAIVFGEQVEAAIGWGWLDLVFSDLEGEGYACGAAVLPACGIGAPHIRQRLWFVADSEGLARGLPVRPEQRQYPEPGWGGEARELADDTIPRRNEQPQRDGGADGRAAPKPRRLRDAGELGNASSPRGGRDSRAIPCTQGSGESERGESRRLINKPVVASPWHDLIWLPCTDGKARPTQPGIFPLAARLPNRVGQLRAAGNAIVPQCAQAFIEAYMTTEQKGKLIASVIRKLKATAQIQKKAFDEGDTFFALAFKTDAELNQIAKLVLGDEQEKTDG